MTISPLASPLGLPMHVAKDFIFKILLMKKK
jgi:hypothetical protein